VVLIELRRANTGWMGKPELKMPDGFSRGTGFAESLKPTHK
jgi:hypothetical protein